MTEAAQPVAAHGERFSATGPSHPPEHHARIEAIDLARGVAIGLMILSHGVKGLLDFAEFTSWGLVPVHLVTKFASSLFILVFGIALAVAYLPHVSQPSWPRRRTRLLLRGVTILFWYKVLTIAEMTPRHPPEQILDALLYRAFPVFTEILGFYGLVLLWLPLVLPLWKKLPFAAQCAVPVLLAGLAWWLSHGVEWSSDALQAILVEHEDHYTWGQLARAPLIFVGLLLGTWILRREEAGHSRFVAAGAFAAGSVALFAGFLALAWGTLREDLEAIARNAGKHPPELKFMLFSVGGAALVLALAFLGGNLAAKVLRPITMVGKDALQAFIAHLFVLCVFYRYLLGYFRAVPYERALTLAIILFVVTWLWIEVLQWFRKHRHSSR